MSDFDKRTGNRTKKTNVPSIPMDNPCPPPPLYIPVPFLALQAYDLHV